MPPTSLTGSPYRSNRAPGAAPSAPAPSAAEQRVRDVLRLAEGSITEASARLGVHRTTLWRWMKRRGMRREDYRS
jgi:transcriptional regulator of acetoin/glycerol metabolism